MECNIFVEKTQVPRSGEAMEPKSVYQALQRVTDRH